MPVAIKGGKVQLTSQIKCRCQYGQTQNKSCTTSTLTVRNVEAITHHFSYDRPVEKQMPGGLPVIRQRRHRRYRFRPWPTRAELEEEGQYCRPMPMHHLDDPTAYRNFIQMLPELYQELEQRITAEFQRDRTLMRDPVSPGVKLAVTLRHLATGDSYTTLQYAFRVASPTIEKFVPEVCDAITRAYRDQVMRCPTLPEDWMLVESVFRRWWNFPHALGALDGRHIPIRCPQVGGSLFHNSKGFHSIVLLALVDGDSKFLWVDMGAARSTSDAQIFKHTNLRDKIEDGSIGFPDSESLGIGGPKVNFFLLGGDTFLLMFWLMRPYSSHSMDLKEMVFNYRIRRERTVVENAFGILTSCFRISQSPLQQEPQVVNRVVMACLVLHNLLRIRYPKAQHEDFRGKGQRTIVLQGNDIPYEGCNAIGPAKRQRNILRDYFINERQLPSPIDSS